MRAWNITRALKRYDSKLYCAPSDDGVLCVFRKSYQFESIEYEGDSYSFPRFRPHYIFALTDTWVPSGTPVDWGIGVILERIQKIDSWNRETFKELMDSYEKAEASRERDRKNKIEDTVREWRPQFAKATADINTSTLEKTCRRRDYEKRKGKLTL